MKLKIEREFKDKYTGKKYTAGSEVEFENERAKELLSDPRDLVTQIKEEEELKAASKKPARKSKK